MSKQRTPEQWQRLFAEHQASGLTQAAFCQQHGVCAKYFSQRRRQFMNAQRKQPVPRFIQVQPFPGQSSAEVSLHYQGMVIHFAQADVRLIADVARSLA